MVSGFDQWCQVLMSGFDQWCQVLISGVRVLISGVRF